MSIIQIGAAVALCAIGLTYGVYHLYTKHKKRRAHAAIQTILANASDGQLSGHDILNALRRDGIALHPSTLQEVLDTLLADGKVTCKPTAGNQNVLNDVFTLVFEQV